ncbi:hypothetical protein OIDMADRAFT_36083 [Oidiodendron maius Zn]|uniref:Uncharacterized protein n=1 Tax=Oidiodendron maius (strain Zn) TaxID=913774 RepID=A0A0C3GNC2_OIDMZ|nr:hypothetical protein OIDMADRAFT_36083 [Oidiodendron maius Zn]
MDCEPKKATSYYRYKVALGYRARYIVNITTYAGRREVIVKVAEDSYKETASMKFSRYSNPNVQDDLRYRPDFVERHEEIKSLSERLKGLTVEAKVKEAKKRQQELQWKQHQAMSEELTSSLFKNEGLYSLAGIEVLRNMIVLYKEDIQVAYRPSLYPKNGCCPVYSKGIDQYRSSVVTSKAK